MITIAPNSAPVISFCPGTVLGLPLSISWSLPNAIIEPEKLSAPTIAENRIEMMILAWMSLGPAIAT